MQWSVGSSFFEKCFHTTILVSLYMSSQDTNCAPVYISSYFKYMKISVG